MLYFFCVFKNGNSCHCFLYGYALRSVRLPACACRSTCQCALAVWGQSWWSGLPERQTVALEDWHCVTPLSVSLISHPFDAAAYIKAVMFEKKKRKKKNPLALNRADWEKHRISRYLSTFFLETVTLQHFMYQALWIHSRWECAAGLVWAPCRWVSLCFQSFLTAASLAFVELRWVSI